MSDKPKQEAYQPIPVDAAKQIVVSFAKDWVVILAADHAHDKMHTVTYGRAADDKVTAAMVGEFCTRSVGSRLEESEFFEDFRAVPAAQARADLEAAHRRIAELEEQLQGMQTTAVSPQSLSEILRVTSSD